MDTLRDYLNKLPAEAKEQFAKDCGTTIGYLRKAISVKSKFDDALCVKIEQKSEGAVSCESLREDLPWVRMEDGTWPHPGGRPLVDHAKAA